MSKQKFPKPTPVLELVHSDGADQGKVAKELGEVAAYPEKVGVEPGKIGAELLKVPEEQEKDVDEPGKVAIV